MLKNILKLEGAQKLTKAVQKSVQGGKKQCRDAFTGQCKEIGKQCAESDCQGIIIEPIE